MMVEARRGARRSGGGVIGVGVGTGLIAGKFVGGTDLGAGVWVEGRGGEIGDKVVVQVTACVFS